MTPYDAGLGDYVDLSKGEFVGRQALEYVNKSCRLYGYVSETAIPNSGLEIFQGSNKVGITKSSCWSPTLEKGIGYVVFDHPDSVGEDWFGKTLSLYDSNQEHHDCVIVELPFFDNEKKIPRGLSDGLSFRD
jgi:aminomethyltransferase